MAALTLLPTDLLFSICRFIDADAVAAMLVTCRTINDAMLRMPSLQLPLSPDSDDDADKVRAWLQHVCRSPLARRHVGQLFLTSHFPTTAEDPALICAHLVCLTLMELDVSSGAHPAHWTFPRSLKALTIIHFRGPDFRGPVMTDAQTTAIIAGIALLTQLEKLELRIRRDFPVEPLLALPKLRELIMPQMTAGQGEPLRSMPALLSLTCHGGKNDLSAADVDVVTAFTRQPHQLQVTKFSLGGINCTEAISTALSKVPTITDGRWCGQILGSNLDFLRCWPLLTSLHLSVADSRITADMLVAAASQCKLVTQFGTMHREMTHAHFVHLLDALPALVDLRLYHHPLCDPVLLFQQAKLDRLTALTLSSTMWRPLLAHPALLVPLVSLRKLDLAWIQPKADEITELRPPSLILPKLHTLIVR